jgi:DNA (cytosine-5)-methyltransferase 1
MINYTSIEICAGAGGQALGLEKAGFDHLALVEIEPLACQTLKHNRPQWNVLNEDVRQFTAIDYLGKVDLFAGGVPCPPFSHAGKQLGQDDERDLFPEALRLVSECNPKAVLLENVRGLLDPKFQSYRESILAELDRLGYAGDWKVLNASQYGVPQLRPRAILVAMKKEYMPFFKWPEPGANPPPTVGDVLFEEMKSAGWLLADQWKAKAAGIAPTLVGGSKKHGGADLGPTRAKKAWATLGVDGGGLANHPPVSDQEAMPKLTLEMTALIQGFPKEWHIVGKKTPAYRQVGNAFPPPVAEAVGTAIIAAFNSHAKRTLTKKKDTKWQKQPKEKAQKQSLEPISMTE